MLAGDTLQEVTAAGERGVGRIRSSQWLAYSFLHSTACGQSLPHDDKPACNAVGLAGEHAADGHVGARRARRGRARSSLAPSGGRSLWAYQDEPAG